MTRPLISLWLAVLMALTAVPAVGAKKEKVPELKDWIRGPVHYITRKQETQAFKALATDEDRALFIDRFWARRDSDPETLVNARRQLFWERVQQANSNFTDSSKPGWTTDRGKIHILYGPPTDIQSDHDLRTDGVPGGARGVIRWIYEGRPAGRMDLDPIVVVPFVRQGTEYRLSYDPKLASPFFVANRYNDRTVSRFEDFFERMGSPIQSRLGVMLDLGRMQEVPPQERVWLERVETVEAYRTHPLQVNVSRYQDDEARTMVVVTVDLSENRPDSRPAVIARFAPVDAQHESRVLGEDSFRLADHALPMAQARIALDPGDYVLTLMVADPTTARTGLHRTRISVPRLSARMRFSDVVWAAQLESLPYAALASYDEPFIVGGFRVLPKLDSVFSQGETLNVFYEVYGGSLPLLVSYQLQGQDDDGDWVSIGHPSTSEQAHGSQGWEMPTSERWPVGEYRVRIEVVDSEGRLITTGVPFTLVASGAS